MRIGDKLVAHGRNVDETILMDSDIHEGAECRHVGHRALKNHARGEIGNLMYALFKGGGLELRARVASGFIQLGDDIGHRRNTEGLIRKVRWRQRAKYAGIANKFRNTQARLLRDAGDERIGLWVYGRGIQRIGTAVDAEETRRLLKGLRPKTRYLLQFLAGSERTVFIAVGHNIGGDGGIDTSYALKQRDGSGIEINAHAVYRTFHDAIKGAGERRLINVVLVLPHTNGLRINLDQLSQRILQAACDGDRAAQ